MTTTSPLDDPLSFATRLYDAIGRIADDDDPRVFGTATYTKVEVAFRALRAALPALEPEAERCLTEVENLTLGLAANRHDDGLRFGVAAECLRHSLVTDREPD